MMIWRSLSARNIACCLVAMAPRPAPVSKPPDATVVRAPVAAPAPRKETAG